MDLIASPQRCTTRLRTVGSTGQILEIGEGTLPSISGDSGRLAYVSGQHDECNRTQLHIRDLATGVEHNFGIGELTKLFQSPPPDINLANLGQAQWSLDGRYVAIGFGTREGWQSVAIIDTSVWVVQLVRSSAELDQRLSLALGGAVNFETLSVSGLAWAADGALALRVSCFGCPPYIYALWRPSSLATPAVEPVLVGDVRPAARRWLGTFMGWVLVAEGTQLIVQNDTKRIIVFDATGGFVLNAAWPEGNHILPPA